jgi:hypothetical protein
MSLSNPSFTKENHELSLDEIEYHKNDTHPYNALWG